MLPPGVHGGKKPESRVEIELEPEHLAGVAGDILTSRPNVCLCYSFLSLVSAGVDSTFFFLKITFASLAVCCPV